MAGKIPCLVSAKSLVSFISATSAILLLLPAGSWGKKLQPATKQNVEYHNGQVLSGKIDLSILWYGHFDRHRETVLRKFIHSLNHKSAGEPQVSTWWKMVEQYQSATPAAGTKVHHHQEIPVRIVKEQYDPGYSAGKVLNQPSITSLVQKSTMGLPSSSVALILSDKDVSVQGTCTRRCSRHGFVASGQLKTLYMVVGNPETNCPNECGWPFNKQTAARHTVMLPLQPPSGSVGTDSMVIGLAAALAETVSNPYNTGFFGGFINDPVEVVSACPNIFGSGAFPGYMGKVRLLPGNKGGCFNSHGVKDTNFLLPALWNPKTRSCWTII